MLHKTHLQNPIHNNDCNIKTATQMQYRPMKLQRVSKVLYTQSCSPYLQKWYSPDIIGYMAHVLGVRKAYTINIVLMTVMMVLIMCGFDVGVGMMMKIMMIMFMTTTTVEYDDDDEEEDY